MKLDIKKIAKSSILFVGAGIIIVILSMILQLLTVLVEGEYNSVIQTITSIFSYLMLPLFLGLFLLAGYRAVRIHGFDAVGAGATAAISYFLIATVHLTLDVLLVILVLSGMIPGGAGFGSSESVAAAAVFGDVTGMLGLGLQIFCGFGLILIGSLFNFVIGGVAGLYASR
ncbi:hypothetical protein JXA56_04425 [Candidatus Micrarchaeota archaeon]|nr:hypothetical protein [Candidatus Micrarchaeota archaeon]